MVRAPRRKPASAASTAAEIRQPRKAERSAYFARREAAKVLRSLLQGDANRRAVGSIKSLVYGPSVRNKKATFALVSQTLKHLPVIKDVLNSTNILNSKWKRKEELMYIITYDILLGQAASLVGDAEKFLLARKGALQSALAQLVVRMGAKNINGLMALGQNSDMKKPRFVRVNTLKIDTETALHELGKEHTVHRDDVVPDLLVLPPAVDLHSHPLVVNGSVFLQGKASCMAAVALQPEAGWEVLDACAAPGNKTVHLAALMRGKGKIIACELNKERIQRLKDTIKLAGTTSILSVVRAILLDPSCSGSGTAAVRLDHLLPSHDTGNAGDIDRLKKLHAFQKKALAHALYFPAVERVVYSTCSIHQIENEDVINSILPLASSFHFQLATPFPHWPRRGRPVFEGSSHLLRTDLVEDNEGFFIALFVRKVTEMAVEHGRSTSSEALSTKKSFCKNCSRTRFAVPRPFITMTKMWLWPQHPAPKGAAQRKQCYRNLMKFVSQ
ncbi:25S rRNA (cytosine-C(5))-methyltransferase NSUN5 isoform X2 [Diospyros lotus]|uniref:25S rRNA (cytosine-C(5))-methyltransferase NSUN5 isoform X2 n=1 Tax=Diospyros lotus TaxID=55363 RepID=UPI002258EAF4|nr:25S rRNA (cytosine-C(5))-methyltransferase NSUN5 isoform X2 [Diospyros lotus]